ncbi:heterokaryon incompatibility protein-domain-containing protein [Podospora didyma]|uniref:Heterokaryon incompatibility protein-domain-containing protein n=1 Tax=Podospora didyma TaxID=330526 RepID=A0AAE0U428_9PEZI|nr:heterokaryon incompatibility protein-domain-containing protein [Podospora didyma]
MLQFTKDFEFIGDYSGPYAILSHTWEKDEKAGYDKIRQFCRLAAVDGFSHGWVDTCCIDKASSAELSEAINSMFRWYKHVTRCYVYLADVPDCQGAEINDVHVKWQKLSPVDHPFFRSRWFSRGWTLQELIAPFDLHFYSSTWTAVAAKKDIVYPLSRITGIGYHVLKNGDLSYVPVSERMRWASLRSTTRIEDTAYSLLGTFEVNLPLLYGEG